MFILFCYLLLMLLPVHYFMFIGIKRERVRNEQLLKELVPKANRILQFPKKPGAW